MALKTTVDFTVAGWNNTQSAIQAGDAFMDRPTKIAPVERPLNIPGPTFAHQLPPYSLSILRLGARQQ